MCAAKQEIPGWKASGGGKVHDNGGKGMTEIILILAVLIVLTLIYREKLVETVTRFYGGLYR